MLDDADVRAVFAGPSHLGLVEAARNAGAQPEHVVVLSEEATAGIPAYSQLLASANRLSEVAMVGPSDIALIYYTSGSTGLPKGVCVSNANSYSGALDGVLSLRLGRNDFWMHTAPLFHMASGMLVWALPMVIEMAAVAANITVGEAPGTTSSTNHGRSCPSACANGRMGSDQSSPQRHWPRWRASG